MARASELMLDFSRDPGYRSGTLAGRFFVRNIRTSLFWLQVTAVAAAMTAGCVENEDKKAPPAPVEPAPVVPPEPGRAAVSIDPAIAYTITTAGGKCLQFTGAGKEDAAQAEVASCNGSKAQQFNLQTVPGGYYAIINSGSGKCLDVSAFAMTDNALVQQYSCNAGQNQNWIVADGSAGSVRLIARHSGKALTVVDMSPGDAGVGKVTQLTAGSGANQQFKIKNPNQPEPAAAESGAGGRKGKEPKAKKGKAAQPAKKP